MSPWTIFLLLFYLLTFHMFICCISLFHQVDVFGHAVALTQRQFDLLQPVPCISSQTNLQGSHMFLMSWNFRFYWGPVQLRSWEIAMFRSQYLKKSWKVQKVRKTYTIIIMIKHFGFISTQPKHFHDRANSAFVCVQIRKWSIKGITVLQ